MRKGNEKRNKEINKNISFVVVMRLLNVMDYHLYPLFSPPSLQTIVSNEEKGPPIRGGKVRQRGETPQLPYFSIFLPPPTPKHNNYITLSILKFEKAQKKQLISVLSSRMYKQTR